MTSIPQHDTAILRRWRFMRVVAALRATAAIWLRRAATRRDLRDLAAHQLVDIGRSEAERRRECAKWFWQK
jgi:uncharacterized protein YjiS (DUF1127 family)